MKRALRPFLLLLLFPGLHASAADQPAPAPAPVVQVTHGSAEFELLGMMNEYIISTSDDGLIDNFYSNEKAAATHFEEVLRRFCEEKKIATDFKNENGMFISAPIAKVLKPYYAKGYLDDSFLAHATEAELLDFVAGCYMRNNDGKKHPEIHTANSASKIQIVASVFVRLGCTNVRLYHTLTLVPTTTVVLFSPSAVVRERLGIVGEMTQAQLLYKFGSNLVFWKAVQK